MAKLFAGALDCPQCGEKLRRWPTLYGQGFVATCPSCNYEQVKKLDPSEREEIRPEEGARDRFRRLLSGSERPAGEDWPEDLLDELPDEAKDVLLKKGSTPSPANAPDGTFRSDTERRLKEHGYYLYEDSHGARLSGYGPRAGTGDLSPLDMVSLAAQLGGGVPAPKSLRACPHCRAVVAIDASRCPWCEGELPPTEGDPPSTA